MGLFFFFNQKGRDYNCLLSFPTLTLDPGTLSLSSDSHVDVLLFPYSSMGHFFLSLSLSQPVTALSLSTGFEGQGTKDREVLPNRIRIKPGLQKLPWAGESQLCIVCMVREARAA